MDNEANLAVRRNYGMLPVPWPLHGALSSVRKSRWFYVFGSAKYAKTTAAAEVARCFGQLGGVDRREGAWCSEATRNETH